MNISIFKNLAIFSPLLRHPVFRNVSWATAGRFLSIGLNILTTAIVARHLGIERFGLYCFAMAFPNMLRVFTTLGLGQIVLRDLSQYPERKATIQGSMAVLYALTGLLTMGLIIGVAYVFQKGKPEVIHLVSIASLTILFTPSGVFNQWFQSQLRTKYIVIVSTATLLLISILKILLSFMGANVASFIWANVASEGITALGVAIIYRHIYGSPFAWQIDFSYIRSILTEGWPKLGQALVNTLGRRSDQVMLGVMAGPSAVAVYAIAFQIQKKLVFLPNIVANSLAPGLSRAKRISEKEFEEKLLISYRIMVLMFLAIGIPLALASHLIINTIYGGEYHKAGIILMLFSLRFIFTNIIAVRSWYITNFSLFKYGLAIALISSLLNFCLNLAFIPFLSSLGAVLATLLASFFVSIIADWFYGPAKNNARIVCKAILSFWKIMPLFNQKPVAENVRKSKAL